jgi:acyl carrier protein phosphodiesterase
MNFLAHLYLSGEDNGLKVGNFIGDFVKGKKYLDYPDEIKKGILLHRSIDHFTDTNPNAREAMKPFKQDYGRYSGIIVDIIFDHFLGLNWEEYSIYSLRDFTKNVHLLLISNFGLLPAGVQKFLPFLIMHRRLESYSFEFGIKRTLEIMSQYTSLPPKTESALKIFRENKTELSGNFGIFMGKITNFVESEFKVGIKKPQAPANFQAK